MAKSKKKPCDTSDLSARVDDLSGVINGSLKKSRKITKNQKKILTAIAGLESEIKNLKICKCSKKKKKKSKAGTADKGIQSAGLQTVMDAPRNGQADDLKLISGVGPKLEQTLNGLGVHHFDQIAAWTSKEIAWVDDYLMFTGRIERDEWIKQARVLAGGAICHNR